MAIYDAIQDKLKSPEFLPRTLFERFNIEVLSTTDGASDSLEHHIKIRESGWQGKVIPAFRPDAVINILMRGWKSEIEKLEQAAQIQIGTFTDYIKALENRREFFKSMGANSTDQGVVTPFTHKLSESEVENIFQRALKGTATEKDANPFLVAAKKLNITPPAFMPIPVAAGYPFWKSDFA